MPLSIQSPKTLILFFSLVLAFNSIQAQKKINLIQNGSFEENQQPNSFRTLKAGEKIKGWNVIKESVDLTGRYFDAYDGHISIDMNGTPGIGAMEQSFFTDKGSNYLVEFYMAGNPVGNPLIKKMLVSAGKQSKIFEFSIEGKRTSYMGWRKCEMVFKAIDRKSTLRFESMPGYEESNYGPTIDKVSVVPTLRKVSSTEKKNYKFTFIYGILGGASYYFLNDNTPKLVQYDPAKNTLEASSAGLGVHLGTFAKMAYGPLFLRPELRLNTNSIKYTIDSNQSGKERYQFLDVPILLGFSFRGINLFAGPTGHLFLFHQKKLADLGDFSSGIKRFTYGVESGIGFDVYNFSLDLRFIGNLGRFSDEVKITNQYISNAPARLMINFAYSLN